MMTTRDELWVYANDRDMAATDSGAEIGIGEWPEVTWLEWQGRRVLLFSDYQGGTAWYYEGTDYERVSPEGQTALDIVLVSSMGFAISQGPDYVRSLVAVWGQGDPWQDPTP